MFMFISGYFFKEKYIKTFRTTLSYFKNKFIKLMIPYVLWAVVYGLFVITAKRLDLVFWSNYTFGSLTKSILTFGTTFNVNGAAWFVPTLFSVIVVYAVIRKLLNRIWNDVAAFAGMILIGALAVLLSKREGFVTSYTLLLLKTAFFLQFYQLGVFFKKYIEKWFDSVNGLLLCLSMIAINFVLLLRYGTITFVKCASMSGFVNDNPFLPLITSVTGIFFWLKISKCLEPLLQNNKLVNYISNHTFFIMIHHLFFINVFSAVLYGGMRLGIDAFSGFNVVSFRHSPWYIFAPFPWVKTAYFLFSIIATLLACKVFDIVVRHTKRLWGNLLSRIRKTDLSIPS